MAAPYTDWMADLYERLKDRKLGEIVIPSAHDAGSFSPDMTGNARTQDQDFGQQLADGVRFFDLRVIWAHPYVWGVFEKNTFYLVHNQTSAKDLKFEPQLDKIAEFAAAHPKEIIILLIAEPVTFPSPQPIDMNNVKGDLVDLLRRKLAPRIFPHRYPPYARVRSRCARRSRPVRMSLLSRIWRRMRRRASFGRGATSERRGSTSPIFPMCGCRWTNGSNKTESPSSGSK